MSKNIYLERYASPTIHHNEKINSAVELIVVLPAFAEKHLDRALASLHACSFPKEKACVLVVINEPENASPSIVATNDHAQQAADAIDQKFQQLVVRLKLPPKKAGVGLARKIGMDEAARFFEKHNKDGIIVCYDADCLCAPNYLEAIHSYFQRKDRLVGHLHYEHTLNGPHHHEIVQYELHLRYYVNALRVIAYPHAIHTLGSCITVTSKAYQKQGGMNTRKAGEDFYFLHKMAPLGGMGEINGTTIYPSDRTSDRVPFGTGHAIDKILKTAQYETYNPKVYECLSPINEDLQSWFTAPASQLDKVSVCLDDFLQASNFQEELDKIINQSGSFENFRQRYYAWWDGFKVLKYIHFARDHHYPNVALQEALEWLGKQTKLNLHKQPAEQQLATLRAYDRTANYQIR
ncbi:glycosyltransferase [Marinoscillum furvescens]|uniref:Glycosyl transferase family 2 n=1 Tax=Marinoscillum furvescens DSM 4134 TaxID=1122208 RepID=A0A3D9L986_MARFU|nr:glycosyltransferase family 2 protein [Marinoscillum furvescens]REE02037.1 hypothetical protein C7460_10256 [Marinoscillum furvescens DSM 4134]